jgi:hypothetical protein
MKKGGLDDYSKIESRQVPHNPRGHKHARVFSHKNVENLKQQAESCHYVI